MDDNLLLNELNMIDSNNNYEEIPLTANASQLIFKKPNYYTEYNKLDEPLINRLSIHDTLFAPMNSILNIYDVIFGSDKVCTQLKHNLAYRHILYVNTGDPITINATKELYKRKS